jgi:uncharacterized protein (DUF433 family)
MKESNAMQRSPSTATGSGGAGTIPVVSEYIVSTPDTCGGAPRIAGSRIRVKDVVIWHVHQGMSPGEIVSKWPHLTLAGVHSALAYYYDRKDKIDEEIAGDAAWFDEMKARSPSLVQEKLAEFKAGDAADDPVSS